MVPLQERVDVHETPTVPNAVGVSLYGLLNRRRPINGDKPYTANNTTPQK